MQSPAEERLHVTALGGLAILMVSAFDAALDGGMEVPVLFARDRPRTRPSFIRGLFKLYLDRLSSLPQRQPQIGKAIENAIRRMYTAELQSAADPGAGRSVWWRKNALPFAVLGMPAWLVADSIQAADFRRHLAWLCRVGEFFGWVDDCVDYAADRSSGHLNRIDIRLHSISPAELVRNIADQASRILSRWDARNPNSPERDYFTVILWSWIENRR